MVVWGQFSWSDACGSRYDIWANYYDNVNGWGTPVKIENIAGAAGWYDIGNDDNGNFIAAWDNWDFCASWEHKIWASRYVKGVGWGTPESIDPSTVNDGPLSLAVDPA
jgi:hypothetical protein